MYDNNVSTLYSAYITCNSRTVQTPGPGTIRKISQDFSVWFFKIVNNGLPLLTILILLEWFDYFRDEGPME